MLYRKLGHTDIKVSVICLGTMTFGQQNSEAEGDQQLDYALDHGVNFIDTAELYVIPPRAETYGATETIIGNWLNSAASATRRRLTLHSNDCRPTISISISCTGRSAPPTTSASSVMCTARSAA